MALCMQRHFLTRIIYPKLKHHVPIGFIEFSGRNLSLCKENSNMSCHKLLARNTNVCEAQILYQNVRQFVTSRPNSNASKEDSGFKKKTLEGGVIIADITVGSGTTAKRGKTVTVYYSGKLKSSSKVFDENREGSGFTFRLGRGEVIDGWDVGVEGMNVGGKRVITCPPAMAYGVKGYPPVIPPNSTLEFEVELKKVE